MTGRVQADEFLSSILHRISMLFVHGPLIGEDKNSDGIRDDIEILVKEKFKDPNKRQFYLELARLRLSMLDLAPTPENGRKYWSTFNNLTACQFSLFNSGYGAYLVDLGKESRWLKYKILNNWKRWRSNFKWLNSTSSYMSAGGNESVFSTTVRMKELCPFEIDLYEKYFDIAMKSLVRKKTNTLFMPDVYRFEKKYGRKYRKRYEKYIK
jgi:hypothetical protein